MDHIPAYGGIVVIDVETTGLGHKARPPREDGVVSVGLAWRESGSGPSFVGGKLRTWEARCDPGERFHADGRADGAFRINGFGVEEVRSFPPAEKVAQELKAQLDSLRHPGPLFDYQKRPMPGITLQSYNIAFDRPFLEKTPWDLKEAWGECIMRDFIDHHGLRTFHYPLAKAAQYASVPSQGRAHGAAADAATAYLVSEWIHH